MTQTEGTVHLLRKTLGADLGAAIASDQRARAALPSPVPSPDLAPLTTMVLMAATPLAATPLAGTPPGEVDAAAGTD